MFNIRTEINGDILNFGNFKDLMLEMKYTDTDEVVAECSYCFAPVGKVRLTLSEVELLASDELLDTELVETIENFVRATKKVIE